MQWIFLQVLPINRPSSEFPTSVKGILQELEVRLDEATSDALVHNSSSVRSQFEEIRDLIPESVVVALHSAAFIEFKLYEYKKAKKNLTQREEKCGLLASSEECLHRSKEEIDKVTSLEATIKEQEDRLAQLKQEHEDLKNALAAKEKEIAEAENLISSSTQALTTQRSVAATALETAERAVAVIPDQIGWDNDDLYVLADIDRIRLTALEVVCSFLYPPL